MLDLMLLFAYLPVMLDHLRHWWHRALLMVTLKVTYLPTLMGQGVVREDPMTLGYLLTLPLEPPQDSLGVTHLRGSHKRAVRRLSPLPLGPSRAILRPP